MNKFIKYLTGKTLQPLVAKYLSTQRRYRYNGIKLQVPQQVFHPGFFFSTKFLLRYINGLTIKGKNFLELGAGSGLIAFVAAKRGATVTATDINAVAVDFLHKNSAANNIPLQVIQSNLFNKIPQQVFDIVAINPPYYKKNPSTQASYAWFCGENSEYFTGLFKTMGSYVDASSQVYMVLSEECDIQLIQHIACQYGYRFTLVRSARRFWEMNYIYKIEMA